MKMVVLARNLRHIQSVEFACVNDTQLQLLVQGLPDRFGDTVEDPNTVCTNLRRIAIYNLAIERLELMSRPLVTLLNHNTRLTRLHIPCELFGVDEVLAAVSKLWNLQHLAVYAVELFSTIQNPFLVLQSCLALPELTELMFSRHIEMDWVHGDAMAVKIKLEAIIAEATRSRFSHPTAKRIKWLQLPGDSMRQWDPLPLLLLKSKLLDLETCEIPSFHEDTTTQEIQDVIRMHCPNLKHLICPGFLNNDQDVEAAQAFIRGCSSLQSFTSAFFRDGPDHRPRLILSELMEHHHATLEALELLTPKQLFSRDLQDVLSQCKQLKRFWVVSEHGEGSLSGIAFRDISRSDWVCTELRELGVTFNRCRSGKDSLGGLGEEEVQDDPHVWLTASATMRAFQQIGRLNKLEILEIDIDRSSRTKAKEQDYAWDLTLCKGWLGEWADLKNLRSLRLRADFWSCMSQEDVEFMHEHWPLLDEIIISSNISEFQTKQHWQWLREKRPHLRLEGMKR
ncbi:hypothetical protein BGZ68_006769 [Mortierella alpina]|nr:hypothetical protein BGZ68_006769 [Mortierella alpina]